MTELETRLKEAALKLSAATTSEEIKRLATIIEHLNSALYWSNNALKLEIL